MTEKTAKWIFWGGTAASLLLFLALTVDTHRQFSTLTHADKLSDQVVAGKRAFERHNCNDCHTVLGFGAYYAPDLTRAYTRLGEMPIRRRLEKPEVAFADSFRKMPHQALSEAGSDDIVSYLVLDVEDREPRLAASTLRKALEAFDGTDARGCGAVARGGGHRSRSNALPVTVWETAGANQAIRFEWIAKRRDAVWIADFLADPEKQAPGCGMPSYKHLSAGQRESVGQFIVALSSGTGR